MDLQADPISGFNSKTKTFHSLRPAIPLPADDTPLSVSEYVLSYHINSPWTGSVAIIDSATGEKLSYCDFTKQIHSLGVHLQKVIKLCKNDVAFILSPNSVEVPVLYFSLLSLGVIVSLGNPVSTESEIAHQLTLSKPVIAFATSETAHKLPKLKHKTIVIDSPEFDSMKTSGDKAFQELEKVNVSQKDVAAIMYSSGTTGRVKGVVITHRNLIAAIAGYRSEEPRDSPPVILYMMPYFHVYGFFYSFKSVMLSETMVLVKKFDLTKVLRAVDEFRVTNMAVSPPVIVAMAKSDLTDGFRLTSLERVVGGGAPLGKDVIAAFTARFPKVSLIQGYGMTETTGAASRSLNPEEGRRWGAVGKIVTNCAAKIVDPDTGDALSPGKKGELWLRGPNIMKGYIGDPAATSATLTSDGWLKTGDLCYIDEDGFVFIVDRLKELIKYKGYQVAPAELEQLLQSHPDIADAAVTGFPDEEAGQLPVAFVVKKPNRSINEKDIMDFVAKQVAPYKKIRRVAFVNSIPKSPAGKILRKDLQKMHLPVLSSRL